MKKPKSKILISVPEVLLKKIDRLTGKAKLDRSAFICQMLEAKIFADECREAYTRET